MAPFTGRRNISSLLLGDVEQGTKSWRSEYDTEYLRKNGLSVENYIPALRPSPQTPRSFKRGYVHEMDYERLEGQLYNTQAKEAELESRLNAMRSTLTGWQDDEATLLAALHQEHQAVQELQEQLSTANSSLQQLTELVQRNRTMMQIVSEGHGIKVKHDGSLHKQVKHDRDVGKSQQRPGSAQQRPGSARVSHAPQQPQSSVRHEYLADGYSAQDTTAVQGVAQRLHRMESELRDVITLVRHVAAASQAPATPLPAHQKYTKRSDRFIERIEVYPRSRLSRYFPSDPPIWKP
mmetsp:Transcript_15155/g.32890  ORF Transcript_15155/g.32890 Transcript_15155/m.32890 type:complete len:293 (-) Transcript_15155:350-1228(-)